MVRFSRSFGEQLPGVLLLVFPLKGRMPGAAVMLPMLVDEADGLIGICSPSFCDATFDMCLDDWVCTCILSQMLE